MTTDALNLIQSKSLVFWDFDGVIKDTLDIKADAFEELFLSYGPEVAGKVRQHHCSNGGVSRFKKIPIYLQFAGIEVTEANANEFANRFSEIIFDRVIRSKWVPGVKPFLLARHFDQNFVLVTATPHDEITRVLQESGIFECFHSVFGAPQAKSDAIARILQELGSDPSDALMIGDTETDLKAANSNGIQFLLRLTHLNKDLETSFAGTKFRELPYE